MNKTGKMIIIVVSIVVLSLFESLLIKGLAGQEQMTNICVSKVEIPQNTVITENMISLQRFPSDSLPAFGVINQQDIVGKYSTITLNPGEIISSNRIVIDEEGKLNSKGKVYISLMPEAEDAVGWQLSKGDFVDLLYYKEGGDDLQISNLKDIKIADLIDGAFKRTQESDLEKKPKFLILEVTPKQAKEIAIWKATGQIVVVGKGPK